MTTNVRSILSCVLLLVVLPVSGQDRGQVVVRSPSLFYTGPVQVRGVSGTLDLEVTEPPTLTVRMGGLREGTATVSIGGAEAVRLEAVDRDQALKLPVSVRRTGRAGHVEEVSVDLRMLVDGAPLATPIGEVDLTLVLPRGVPALIRSNQPVTQATPVDGRVSYRFVKAAYLTNWRVAFTTGPVTLQMEKRLEPAAVLKEQQPVVVTLRVRNLGPGEARAVELADDLDPRDFAADGKGFEAYVGKENDRRLLWRGAVERLAPGEETIVRYQVKALRPVHSVSLPAARATIGGEVVGLSNKVFLEPLR